MKVALVTDIERTIIHNLENETTMAKSVVNHCISGKICSESLYFTSI